MGVILLNTSKLPARIMFDLEAGTLSKAGLRGQLLTPDGDLFIAMQKLLHNSRVAGGSS